MKKVIFVLVMAVMVTGCNRVDRICPVATADARAKFVLECSKGSLLNSCIVGSREMYCYEVLEAVNESNSTSTKP